MPDIALIGCAHIHTPGFVNTLKGRTDVRVKYVWDPEAPRAAKWAGELGTKAIASAGKALKDPDVKGVVICSQTHLHKKLVAACAAAGKHMFVEKPLGMGAKDSLAMAQTIQDARVMFQTGYFSRSNPAFMFIKEQVDKGTLGRITRVRGSNCHSGSLGGWFDDKADLATNWRWMADPKIAGCGAFGDLGTHLLDILMWLMGDVQSVTASIKSITGRYGDTDESGEAMIQFKNGVTGTLAAGWVDVANPVSLLVSGTEGHAAVINGQLFFSCKKVEGADGKQPWTQLPQGLPHAFNLFLDALCGQSVPLVPVQEAAARVVVMEAMYKASKSRKWIELK